MIKDELLKKLNEKPTNKALSSVFKVCVKPMRGKSTTSGKNYSFDNILLYTYMTDEDVKNNKITWFNVNGKKAIATYTLTNLKGGDIIECEIEYYVKNIQTNDGLVPSYRVVSISNLSILDSSE